MSTWQSIYPTSCSLNLHQGEAIFSRSGEDTKRCAMAALRANTALLSSWLSGFEFSQQLEIEACLLEDSLPASERLTPNESISLVGRPYVARYMSDNLGKGPSTYNIWLFGRSVIVEVRGCARLECSFKDLLASGISADRREKLGHVADELLRAVAALNALPCFCGTGAERPSQHGDIHPFVSRQHPEAPIDHVVTVGRCRVCGRGWTFTESGDSHYSYTYDVRPYPP